MSVMQSATTIVTSVVMPSIIQAIKSGAMGSNEARWVAIAMSAVCGVLAAMADGMPGDPSAWVSSILACVGGVQVAYSAFKSVGVTDRWLDALLAADDPKGGEQAWTTRPSRS